MIHYVRIRTGNLVPDESYSSVAVGRLCDNGSIENSNSFDIGYDVYIVFAVVSLDLIVVSVACNYICIAVGSSVCRSYLNKVRACSRAVDLIAYRIA